MMCRLFVIAAAFITVTLTGCGASQPPIGAPGVETATSVAKQSPVIERDLHSGSWMRKITPRGVVYESWPGEVGNQPAITAESLAA